MPASNLLNLQTDSGWSVVEQLQNQSGSGGNFCNQYKVVKGRKEAFLKAMDLSSVMSTGDLNVIQEKTSHFIFEFDMLDKCNNRKMKNVVVPIDKGVLSVPNAPIAAPFNKAWYIIFELADGDIRKEHLVNQSISWLTVFKHLKDVVKGLHQLHMAGIAHQDLKPSNVLCFSGSARISDLGRVVDLEDTSPFGGLLYPGDPNYIPFESIKQVKYKNFKDRYLADIFHVGSLLFHMVENVQINVAIHNEAMQLDKSLNQLSYIASLPIYESAFYNILDRHQVECKKLFGEKVSQVIIQILEEMCHPNLEIRGNQHIKLGKKSLVANRYVGKFAQLIRVATIEGVQ